jgi:hypothetical protein
VSENCAHDFSENTHVFPPVYLQRNQSQGQWNSWNTVTPMAAERCHSKAELGYGT